MKGIILTISLLTFTLFILFIIHKYGKNDTHESFTGSNLIQNSSFFRGKNIENVEKHNTNNKIIVMNNPGPSSYVIQQSAKLTTKNVSQVIYQINIKVTSNKQYSLKCWVLISDNWNGKNDIFYLKLWQNKGNPLLKISKGDVIKTKTLDNNIWELRQYILICLLYTSPSPRD